MPLALEVREVPAQDAANVSRHFVYASRSAKGAWTDAELRALIEKSEKFNASVGIRGILLVLREYFVQWLQGPPDAVEALAEKIARDSRHERFQVLHDERGPTIIPRPWLTVRASRTEPLDQLTARVEALCKASREDPSSSQLSPYGWLRAFTLPAPLPHNSLYEHHRKKLRVVLTADDLLWPAAVVHAVSRRAEVHPQRTLFGTATASKGSSEDCVEYVDVVNGARCPLPYRMSACASPTVNSAYAESVFADAHLVVFLVRASRVDAERERLLTLLSLPCFTESSPELMLLFSQAAESGKASFLRDLPIDPARVSIHSLSLSDSDAVLAIVESKIAKIAARVFDEAGTSSERASSSPSPARSAPLYLAHSNERMMSTAAESASISTTESNHRSTRENDMANVAANLQAIMKIDGASAAALVDYNSGMTLGMAGGGINIEVAAAGNTEVIRAKMKVAKALGLDGAIEDMLITLTTQFHVIRPVAAKPGLFYYVVIDRAKGNLAMARYQISEAEKQLQL